MSTVSAIGRRAVIGSLGTASLSFGASASLFSKASLAANTAERTSTQARPPAERVAKGIGLALGAGAARGLAHIGVLQALDEAKIEIQYVVGTSSGALVGALYAAGISPWQLQELALKTSDADLIDFDTGSKNSLITGALLQNFVSKAIGGKRIEELKRRFACVATDINTGAPVILQSGDTAQAVRASCAIPSFFLPVTIGNATLVDGALVMPLPTSTVRAMGAKHVIASSVAGNVKPMKQRGFYETVLQSFEVMTRSLINLQSAEANVLIQPDVDKFASTDFQSRKELIQAGYEAGLKSITKLRQLRNP